MSRRRKNFGTINKELLAMTNVTILKHGFASFYNLFCTVSSKGRIWKRNDNSRSCLDPREIVHSINSYRTLLLSYRHWWDQYVKYLETEILEDICHQVLFFLFFFKFNPYMLITVLPKSVNVPQSSICTRNFNVYRHVQHLFVTVYYTAKSGFVV